MRRIFDIATFIAAAIVAFVLALCSFLQRGHPECRRVGGGRGEEDEDGSEDGEDDRGRGDAAPERLGGAPKRTKSEQKIIDIFESITQRRFPQAHPAWLKSRRGRSLELDGFCRRLGIAVEFSGPLHTKWYPDIEPYETYFMRISRDRYKIAACKKRNVKLIVVDMSIAALHSSHRYNYVHSRLYDAGAVKERPMPYIEEQFAEPFRNEELERELGLENQFGVLH